MAGEFLGERRKGLEEEFFRRQEAALLARHRAEAEQHAARAALAAASQIRDEALLGQIVLADTGVNLLASPAVRAAYLGK